MLALRSPKELRAEADKLMRRATILNDAGELILADQYSKKAGRLYVIAIEIERDAA